ncbi:MAG: ABC transporter permease subunit [Treponema sp.]|jgi:L-cystine transport system permease protein|nr:ABC transporter permease subunit [Treponema sp.]
MGELFILECIISGLKALPVTAYLTLGSFSISLIFGSALAIIRINNVPVLSPIIKIYIDIIKAVPSVLVLYVLYFFITDGFNFLSKSFGWGLSSSVIHVNVIAIIVLAFSGTITVSETIRGSFMAVNYGQYEAAYSVGLTGWQTLKRIVLPQVIPVAIPVLCNNFIVFVKHSSLMYFIAVTDVLNATLAPAAGNYRFLEAYIAAGVVYWGICLFITQLSKLMEKQLSRFRHYAV